MNMAPPAGIELPQGDVFLDGNYDVYIGDKAVGKVYVCTEGLYLRFQCRCDLSGEVISQLQVACGNHVESLGILIPMGHEFGLETRIPAKRLGQGSLRFFVKPRHREFHGQYIPIAPEEPYRYLSRLKDSYLENRNGRLGIVIKEQGCG